MKKPGLLFINPNQFGYSAGYFHYCIHLKDKYDITFITFDRGLPIVDLSGISVIYLPYGTNKIRRLITLLSKTIQICSSKQTDILFTVYFKLCFLLPLFAKTQVKILDIRSGELTRFGNFFIWCQSLFFRNICILSDSLRAKLRISAGKCFLLSLGSDIFFNGDHDFSQLSLLYIGSFNYRNIDQTIEGLAIFLNKNDEFRTLTHYYIIGFGSASEEQKLLKTIESCNIQQNVTLVGRKQYLELVPYFEKCNIGVVYVPINDFYEFQPVTKFFEYGLSGLYSIATNTYENRRFVNVKNGVLCDDNASAFAEALKFTSDNLTSLSSADIRATVKSYEWKNLMTGSLIPYLNSLLS